jgi:hypothetical protein
MGTKTNPSKYDCFANAKPDEPMFVLLGRDPMAGALVRLWAAQREDRGENPDVVAEARACADDLDAWARQLGKEPTPPDFAKDLLRGLGQIQKAFNDLMEHLSSAYSKAP